MDIHFLLILLPAALADSISPCAFAILFVILGSILSETGSHKKVLQAGFAFCLSIFMSYYLMGIWLYRAFAFASQAHYLQIFAAVLALFIGLGNIKDYFWPEKGWSMEMPTFLKLASKKYLKKIHSPSWAFVVGILISLFLLPCTGGPYLTVLSYLASENATINLMGYIYLLIYNLVFITPFLCITGLVYFGTADISVLKEYRETYKQEIHLAVGILMLGLGLYLVGDIWFF